MISKSFSMCAIDAIHWYRLMWVARLILVHPSSPILSPLVVAWIETPWLMITHPRHRPSRKALVMQLLKTPTPQNFLPFWNQHWAAPSHPSGWFGVSPAADMWHWWSEAKDRDCGGSASSADTYMPPTIAGHTIYSVLLACNAMPMVLRLLSVQCAEW